MVTHSFADHLACPGIRPAGPGASVAPGPFCSFREDSASPLTNTFNSTPAPTTCKGFFAGLTLFDLFFFFLTLLKKYQKVQFACFALDTDGVLVYREKKSLNQEAFIVGHFGEKEKPCHGDPS